MLAQNRRNLLSILLIGLLVFAQLTIILPKVVLAADSRLAGSDRYSTAVKVSQAGWNKSDYVILVRGDDFADALCAGPLAKKYNAPILFTEKYLVNTSTLKEIERLEADKVIIIGGYGAISRNVDKTLDSEGIAEIERIYGDNRYETSVKIAQRLGSKEAALATGGEYADALSISAVASAKGFSILLTYPNDLPGVVKQHLSNYKIENIYLIGGEKAITKNTEEQVRSPLRFAGKNRYETNRLVLEYFAKDLDFNKIFTAPGEGKDNYTYALAGAALAAQTSSPIVLNSSILPEETKDFVRSKMTVASEIIAIGGEDVVPVEIFSQYRQGFNQMLKSIFDQEGVYGPSTGTTTIAGSLAIENSNIIVQNTVIEGDLLLGEGIRYGTVELRNVTVKGRTTIRSGWNHSIIGDNLIAPSVILDSEGEKTANLALLRKSKVNNVLIHSYAYLDDSENTSEGFSNVDILSGKGVILRGGFNTVSFTAKGADVRLRSATVKTLNAKSSGYVWGTGTINTANISSNDVKLDIIPAVTNVAKGYQAYVGGERISEGITRAADIAALQNEPIRDLKATAGNGLVSFTFSQPTDATGVILKQSTDGGSTWKNASTGSLSKSSTSATATGLINGQKYYFMLVVTGGIRAGESNKVSAAPVENGITDLAGIPGNGKVTLAFSPPTGSSGVTLKQSLDGGLTWKNSSTSSPLNKSSTLALVTGLVNGTTYQFKLVVVGGSRAGDSNVTTVTPVDPIADLTGLSPERGMITLTFSAAPGATKVTLRQSSNGGTTWEDCPTTPDLNYKSTSATVTGLINGQEYSYKLLVIGGARAGESNIATVIAQ